MSMYPEASSPIGSPYIPAGGNNMGGSDNTPNPNQIGIGGNTGSMSPVAQQMQGMGRGEDSMLIHMTPGEVGGLQALAQAHGGSLTINPHTGLPEAGFLSKLLPTLLGFGLNFILPGLGPLATAAIVGGGVGLAKGSLTEGLMAGLGAFGGASLGAGLSAAGTSAATNAITSGTTALDAGTAAAANAGTAGSAIGSTAINAGAANAANAAITGGAGTAAGLGSLVPAASTVAPIAETAASAAAPLAETAAGTGIDALGGSAIGDVNAALPFQPTNILGKALGERADRFGTGFSEAAGKNLMGAPGKVTAMRTGTAAAGVGLPIMEAFQPQYKEFVPEDEGFNYEGPYRASKRRMRLDIRDPNSSGERMYFEDTNPFPGFVTASGGTPSGYASGGATKTPQLKPADLEAAIQLAKDQYNPRPDDYVIGGAQEHNYGFQPMATFMPKGAGILDRGISQGNTFSGISNLLKGFYDEQGNFVGKGGRLGGGSADDYYLNPETGRMEPKPTAAGGMHLKNGSFIVDARTVSELGNGSSRAGQDLLARYGGQALHGPGDGVSDSIHANIGGTQEARVARDEVKFDPEAVARLGGGNANTGTKKLYALMAKAEKARKSAKRGQDTGLKAIMGS